MNIIVHKGMYEQASNGERLTMPLGRQVQSFMPETGQNAHNYLHVYMFCLELTIQLIFMGIFQLNK